MFDQANCRKLKAKWAVLPAVRPVTEVTAARVHFYSLLIGSIGFSVDFPKLIFFEGKNLGEKSLNQRYCNRKISKPPLDFR